MVGVWNTSIAQALAAETSKLHSEHLRWEQAHPGKRWQDKQDAEFKAAQQARAVMDDFGRKAYDKVLSYPDGWGKVMAYLNQKGLCGTCLNVTDSVNYCRNGCGRQLCGSCRSDLYICTNTGTCRQPHPVKWRVGIKLLDQDDELYKQWKVAALDADRCTDIAKWGHRLAAHPTTHETKLSASRCPCQQPMMQHSALAHKYTYRSDGTRVEARHIDGNLIEHTIKRWENSHGSAAGQHDAGTPSR